MAVNLARLEQAADRYEKYAEKKRAPDSPAAGDERARVARRHRDQFLPPADKMQQVRSAAVVSRILEAAAEPSSPSDLAVIEGGVIPEILRRENDLRPVRYLQIALLAARSVGRVRVVDAVRHEGDGTGFLVAPGLVMAKWDVLKTRELAEGCSVVFDDEDGLDGDPKETKVYRFLPDRLYVSDRELDYAIVEVSPRTGSGTALSQYGFLRLFEQTGKLDPTKERQAANIIQHPGGGPKKIAIRDNYFEKLVPDAVDATREVNSLFYGSDTLKGSSGAPVCSDQWYVVALHRGGVPKLEHVGGRRVPVRRDGTPALASDPPDLVKYISNEGTRISRIYESLRAKRRDPHAAAGPGRLLAVSPGPPPRARGLPRAPIGLPTTPAAEEGAIEEIIRRAAAKFKDARGYKSSFLGTGFSVPLPSLTSEVERELAPLKDSAKTELKYDHYSLKINRERRTAFFVAANVNGPQLWDVAVDGARPGRPKWSFDPRMREEFQPDDVIFSTQMQRGHLYKREDVWGTDTDLKVRADEHSFTITNATPMIANFNNVEWGDLEDIVTREADRGNKVSYFAGPIFRPSDPFFNELTSFAPADQRHTGMRVPQSFWKIVFWVENRALKAAGFVLSQTNEIETHGPITEEINFGNYRKKRITEIEQRTGLRFPKLVAADTFGT